MIDVQAHPTSADAARSRTPVNYHRIQGCPSAVAAQTATRARPAVGNGAERPSFSAPPRNADRYRTVQRRLRFLVRIMHRERRCWCSMAGAAGSITGPYDGQVPTFFLMTGPTWAVRCSVHQLSRLSAYRRAVALTALFGQRWVPGRLCTRRRARSTLRRPKTLFATRDARLRLPELPPAGPPA